MMNHWVVAAFSRKQDDISAKLSSSNKDNDNADPEKEQSILGILGGKGMAKVLTSHLNKCLSVFANPREGGNRADSVRKPLRSARVPMLVFRGILLLV